MAPVGSAGRSFADTLDLLRQTALDADDAAGHFPAMYARVTRAVGDAATAGRFDDAERMRAFVESFADRYLDTRPEGAEVPQCWRAAADVAGDQRLLIVQHLLLGINAHVNHDLPLVVVDLADAGGDLGELRRDFDAINDILVETVPSVLASLDRVSRWVNVVAFLGGGRAFNFSLVTARDQAWRAATRIHALGEPARAVDIAELDRLVSVLSYLVTQPARVLSVAVAAIRRLETQDPVEVTRLLLGDLA